uniref:Uncharacterized protein n=1 Tax=Oryza brachyantha TaxID=4533 RepID=J3LCF3_ORYBR
MAKEGKRRTCAIIVADMVMTALAKGLSSKHDDGSFLLKVNRLSKVMERSNMQRCLVPEKKWAAQQCKIEQEVALEAGAAPQRDTDSEVNCIFKPEITGREYKGRRQEASAEQVTNDILNTSCYSLHV